MAWNWKNGPWGQTVLAWWGLARDQETPDPATLRAAIEDRTLSLALPSYAAHVPVAERTCDRRFLYPATVEETQPIRISFGGPALLVGLGFEVTPASYGACKVPKLKELDVSLQIGLTSLYLSSREDTSCEGAPMADGFVPMSQMDIGRRLIMKEFSQCDAFLNVKVRGRYADANASGFGSDLVISVTAHITRLSRPVDA